MRRRFRAVLIWREPGATTYSRFVICAFLFSAFALVVSAFSAGISARAPHPSVSQAAAADLVTTPGCGTVAGPMVAAPAAGRIEDFAVDGRKVIAYVPPADPSRPARRLPVVYFLHGSPGTAAGWLGDGHLPAMLDRLQALGELPPMIAIFPDGNASGDDWWADVPGGPSLESWFVSRLVPSVDARYPTLGAAVRGIAGISAGGFGAVNMAVHHPGLFTWVGSYSGVFSADLDTFGPVTKANTPALTIFSLPPARRFPLFLGAGADDSQYRSETDGFVSSVKALGWPVLDAVTVPGDHGWDAWGAEARDSLVWLGKLWKTDPAMRGAMTRSVADPACP